MNAICSAAALVWGLHEAFGSACASCNQQVSTSGRRSERSPCVVFFAFTELFLILPGLQELPSPFSHYSFILAAVPLELVILIRGRWRGEILLKCNCSLMAFPLWHCVGSFPCGSAGFAAWL